PDLHSFPTRRSSDLGGIASIATVIGARRTVRLSVVLYLLAGLLLLATEWPGQLAAVLALPYVVNQLPWWRVTDDTAPGANRGWRSEEHTSELQSREN